uniref:Uncharacterized protein n=1 Tax=Rangifer tarandus platyrhynchus TaxID=3082113 RepID=A0ACB0EL14_RANTA|nr:unnamed protein product [Rangifer tarandus platyrhynchus]
MVSPFGPIGTESPGTVARAWGLGSKGLRQGFFGAQSKGRGARSPPGEAQEPGAELEGVGGRGGSRRAGIAANLQPHLYRGGGEYLPHRLVSMVLGAGGGGGGARLVGASVCELSPPTARGPLSVDDRPRGTN